MLEGVTGHLVYEKETFVVVDPGRVIVDPLVLLDPSFRKVGGALTEDT